MSKDDKGNGKRPPHTGSTAAEDLDLSLWLNKLWARNEPPERVECWQMFGRNKVVRGEMIFHQDFKPGDKLDIEQANHLANEIMAAAQNDCDSTRREAWYQLSVVDPHRRASPLVRRVGPLQPKRTYALKTLASVDNEEDDDESLNGQTLALRHIKEGFEQVRWDKQRNDRVVEGMLLLQDNIIKNQQQAIDRFFDKVISSFEKMQEAEDRRVQREILIEKERFRLGLMKDGVRTARNLLPGIFGGTETGGEAVTGTANGNNGATNGTAAPKDYGPSPERTLADNFLRDCQEAAIDTALFGEMEERDGALVQTKEGIFSPKQLRILIGVSQGRLPVDALDALMPKSGHALAITQEQVEKAGAAGVTEGIGMALMEIVGLRQRAREAKEAKAKEAKETAPKVTVDDKTEIPTPA